MITIVISTLLAWSRKIVAGSCLWKGRDLRTQKPVTGSLATFGKFGTASYFTPFTLGSPFVSGQKDVSDLENLSHA